MIIVIKKNAEQSQVDNLLALLKAKGITPHVSQGAEKTIIGCVGDVSSWDPSLIEALDFDDQAVRADGGRGNRN